MAFCTSSAVCAAHRKSGLMRLAMLRPPLPSLVRSCSGALTLGRNLNFVQPRSVLLHQNDAGVWYEASANLQQAHRGLVAQFRNRPSKVGQTAPKASSVSASLIFKSPEISEELHINHAVWLGRY